MKTDEIVVVMNLFHNYIFLQKFLFVKAFRFSKKILRERKNPQFYATRIYSIPSAILAFDIYNVMISLLPVQVEGIWNYIYFCILLLLIFFITDTFVFKEKGYKELVDQMDSMTAPKKQKWKTIAFIYVFIIATIATVFLLY